MPAKRLVLFILLATSINVAQASYDCESLGIADSLRRARAYEQAIELYEQELAKGDLNFDCRLVALVRLGLSFEGLGQEDKALKSQRTAQRLAIQKGDTLHPFFAHALNNEGLLLEDAGELSLAMSNFERAKLLYRSLDIDVSADVAIRNQAHIYMGRGELEKALRSHLEALKGFESRRDTLRMAGSYSTMAIIQGELGAIGKAYKFHHEAIRLRKRSGDPKTLGSFYNNISLLFLEEEKYDSARYYLELSLPKSGDLNSSSRAVRHNNLARACFELGDYQAARQHFKEAVRLRKTLGDTDGLAKSMMGLAQDYETEWKEGPEAYMDTLRSMLGEIESKSVLRDYFELRKDRFLSQGQLDSAMLYFQKLHQIEQELDQEQYLEELAGLQEQYEADKREEEIVQLEDDNSDKAQKLTALERSIWFLKRSLWSVVAFLVLGIAVLVLAIKVRERRLKHEKLVAEVEGEEKERERLARELHDASGSRLRRLKSALGQLLTISDEGERSAKIQDIEEELGSTITELVGISHRIQHPDVHTDLHESLSDLVYDFSDDTGLEVDYDGTDDANGNEEVNFHLYRIVQEALTNVYRHAEADMAKVSLRNNTSGLELSISDNGKGLEEGVKGGIGLRNIQRRVDILKGHLDIRSSNKGLTLSISIPMHDQ